MRKILFSSLVAATLIAPRLDSEKLQLHSLYIQRNIKAKTVYVDRLNEAHFLVPFSGGCDGYYDCLDVNKDGKLDRIAVRRKLENCDDNCERKEIEELNNPYLFQRMNRVYSKIRRD